MDPVNADFKAIQLVQNKLLQSLNGTKVREWFLLNLYLKKFNMLPVTQLNAQVKLLEVWKALNVPKYLLTIKQ